MLERKGRDPSGMIWEGDQDPARPPHTAGRCVGKHGAQVWWESTPRSPPVSRLSLGIPGQALLELEVLRLAASPEGSDEGGSVGPPHFLSLHQLPPDSRAPLSTTRNFQVAKTSESSDTPSHTVQEPPGTASTPGKA